MAQLTDIDIKEVSLVDRPANKKKFLLYKREEDNKMLKPEEIEAKEKELTKKLDELKKGQGELEDAKKKFDEAKAEHEKTQKAIDAKKVKDAMLAIKSALDKLGAAMGDGYDYASGKSDDAKKNDDSELAERISGLEKQVETQKAEYENTISDLCDTIESMKS